MARTAKTIMMVIAFSLLTLLALAPGPGPVVHPSSATGASSVSPPADTAVLSDSAVLSASAVLSDTVPVGTGSAATGTDASGAVGTAAVGTAAVGTTAVATGECVSSPGAAMRPSVRPADRHRSRRAGPGAGAPHVDVAPAVLEARPAAGTPAPAGRAGGGRLLDLRALSGPAMLRVIRS